MYVHDIEFLKVQELYPQRLVRFARAEELFLRQIRASKMLFANTSLVIWSNEYRVSLINVLKYLRTKVTASMSSTKACPGIVTLPELVRQEH